jgi:hypothetical protein
MTPTSTLGLTLGRPGELAVLAAAGSWRDPDALATLTYRDPMTEWIDRRKFWQIALIGCGAGLIGASLAIAGALSGGAPFRVAAAVSVALAGSLSGTLSLTGECLCGGGGGRGYRAPGHGRADRPGDALRICYS